MWHIGRQMLSEPSERVVVHGSLALRRGQQLRAINKIDASHLRQSSHQPLRMLPVLGVGGQSSLYIAVNDFGGHVYGENLRNDQTAHCLRRADAPSRSQILVG